MPNKTTPTTIAKAKAVPDYIRFDMFNTPNRLIKLESYDENFSDQPRGPEPGKKQRAQDASKNWTHFDKVFEVDQDNTTSLGIVGDVLQEVPLQVPDIRKKLFTGIQTNKLHSIGVVGDTPVSVLEAYQSSQPPSQLRRTH